MRRSSRSTDKCSSESSEVGLTGRSLAREHQSRDHLRRADELPTSPLEARRPHEDAGEMPVSEWRSSHRSPRARGVSPASPLSGGSAAPEWRRHTRTQSLWRTMASGIARRARSASDGNEREGASVCGTNLQGETARNTGRSLRRGDEGHAAVAICMRLSGAKGGVHTDRVAQSQHSHYLSLVSVSPLTRWTPGDDKELPGPGAFLPTRRISDKRCAVEPERER